MSGHRDLPNSALASERSRVRLLYRQSPVAQITGLLNVGIYFYISLHDGSARGMTIWLAFAAGIYAVRFGLQAYFRRRVARARPFDPVLWENTYAVGTSFSGLIWGIAGTWLLADASIVQQAFLGFILAGTSAAAAVAYCISYRTVLAFLIPSVIPFAFHMAGGADVAQTGMAMLLFVYVLFISITMRRMSKSVRQSISLRIEKDSVLEELHRTQAKFVNTAKMAALGEMASSIAHEINNPLAIIRGRNALIRQWLQNQPGKEAENALLGTEKIEATVIRIAKIISGLKNFAREGDRDKLENVPLRKIIVESLELCQIRFINHGIAVTVSHIPADLVIQTRSVQVCQVLLNLMNNAFDAVQNRSDGAILIEVDEREDSIDVSVTDNGPGVPQELRQKIMQPFFTTKAPGEGTGLGLSIAHGIMQSHGGRLLLDEDAPQTRFIMRFPKKTAAAAAA